MIVAGLGTAAGLTLTGGGPASAATLPQSCSGVSTSAAASEAAAAVARMSPSSAAAKPMEAAMAPAATAAATVTPLAGTAKGIDISSHNAEPAWATLKSGGASFVAIKATEGDYYVNEPTQSGNTGPGYTEEAAAADQAGLYVMPYAFGNPHEGNGDGICQADYAWQEIGPANASSVYTSSNLSLPVVLDIEQDPYANSDPTAGAVVNSCYNQTTSGMTTWIGDFLTEMKANSGKTPIIYTNPSFWSSCTGNATSFTTTAGTAGSFTSYPLWLADYGVTSPPAVAGWSSPTFWQYTDAATVSGESATVDGDYLTPLQQTGKVGTAVKAVQVTSLSALAGQSVTYTAAGLPPGLTISTSGLISGTPTAAGSFTATVTPSAGPALSLIWDVTGTLTFPAQAARATYAGNPVSVPVSATDTNAGASGYTPPKYTASGLPAGLSINSATGLITGWPSTYAAYSVKVTATDGLGATASASFTWTVKALSSVGTAGWIRQWGGSNKCVDDPSSKTANATVMDLRTCTGASNQTWTTVADGTIRVLGHCLTASGTGVYLFSCSNSIAEQWRAGSFGELVSARYGTCLNGPAGAVAEGTKVTLATCLNTASKVNQHWNRPVAPIVSGVGARCLNVAVLPGNAVTSYTCGNYTTEHWTRETNGSLQAQSSGKCLTESTTPGSALIQYTCVGTANQQWTIVAAGTIAVELKNPATGLCATVPAANSPNGTKLVLGTCSSALTSTWRVG